MASRPMARSPSRCEQILVLKGLTLSVNIILFKNIVIKYFVVIIIIYNICIAPYNTIL